MWISFGIREDNRVKKKKKEQKIDGILTKKKKKFTKKWIKEVTVYTFDQTAGKKGIFGIRK